MTIIMIINFSYPKKKSHVPKEGFAPFFPSMPPLFLILYSCFLDGEGGGGGWVEGGCVKGCVDSDK